MTVQQAHIEFKFRMDKLDALNYANFLPEEIDLLLNNAQDKVVKQRYGRNNNKRESFEETQKRTEDLKNIVVNAVLTPLAYASDNIDVNARFVNLPLDHWFTVQERCSITCTTCNLNELVEVIPIQHSEFSKVIKDPYKRPNTIKVLRLMEQGRAELVASPICTITDYRLRYIKQPQRVDITTNTSFELSESIQSEIIDAAVQIALESIEAKRNTTFIQTNNNNE